MRFPKHLAVQLVLCGMAVGVSAQAPPRLGPNVVNVAANGAVTGRVLCSDTQRPARFAQVLLVPAEEASNPTNRENFGRRAAGRTDLDGVFSIANVTPGDYYVAGSATGYISEASLLMAAGADQASALAKLPSVHISASATSTVNLSLERGGVIAGRVQWDDGSPAAGVQVGVVNATAAEVGQFGPGGGGVRALFGGFGEGTSAQTDDRGQFRITGLAPGAYLVRSVVQAPAPATAAGGGGQFGRNSVITMYAPGKVRRSEAQTITVRASEERADLTMVLDLTALHRVTGHVGAASGTVGSGTVRLTDTQDSSLSRTGQINADGSYILSYVPVGTYTFSVPFASSATSQLQSGPNGRGFVRPASSFQPFSETLSVTGSDLTGVDVTLTPAASTASSQ